LSCLVKEGNVLHFNCGECGSSVEFCPLSSSEIKCGCCEKQYTFSEELSHQLTLFRDLCVQIHRSQEILGQTSIAIDLEEKQLRIPYNLLLTRLSSVIELEIEGKVCELTFRIEPGKDLLHFS
jgi:heterodisulfide reductase subunit A-like polyferredoxin